MLPLECMQRLAALVPRSRLHLIRFHGVLAPNAKLRASVLCLHGHDDPMGPPADVLAFETEMTAANADWQLHVFGRTKHAFTNPAANDHGLGTVYNQLANDRAQRAIADFLAELFASPTGAVEEEWQAD